MSLSASSSSPQSPARRTSRSASPWRLECSSEGPELLHHDREEAEATGGQVGAARVHTPADWRLLLREDQFKLLFRAEERILLEGYYYNSDITELWDLMCSLHRLKVTLELCHCALLICVSEDCPVF